MNHLAGTSDGQTPLDAGDLVGLIPSWVSTRADLDLVEQEGIARTIGWARTRRLTPARIVAEPFVRQLHRRMFGGVWKWAGQYRQRDVNIGVAPAYIPEEIAKLIGDARYWLDDRPFPADEVAVRFHHRLVWVHPFPNGNGRHARLAADLLIAGLGEIPLTWGAERAGDGERVRREYIASLRKADAGDVARLVAFARS